jgi:hypothetical protein
MSGALSGAEWTPPAGALAHARAYVWQVTASRGSDAITAPAQDAPEACFEVLEDREARELDAAQRVAGDSHLALGVTYARAGLLEEAEREFRLLLEENPASATAQKLLRDLRAQEAAPATLTRDAFRAATPAAVAADGECRPVKGAPVSVLAFHFVRLRQHDIGIHRVRVAEDSVRRQMEDVVARSFRLDLPLRGARAGINSAPRRTIRAASRPRAQRRAPIRVARRAFLRPTAKTAGRAGTPLRSEGLPSASNSGKALRFDVCRLRRSSAISRSTMSEGA